MGGVLLNLLPLIVSSVLLPALLIVVLFLIKQEGGVGKTAAFAAGVMLVRVLQVVVFGYVLDSVDEGGSDGRVAVAVLVLVLGVFMLVSGVRALFKEEDPEAPPPRWIALLERTTPVSAFGFGAVWMIIGFKHWAFVLGAIGVVQDGDVSRSQEMLAYAIFVIGASLNMLVPVAAMLMAPDATRPLLERMGAWLERYSRIIAIIVYFLFGALFLSKALNTLL